MIKIKIRTKKKQQVTIIENGIKKSATVDVPMPKIIKKGEWIDLTVLGTHSLMKGDLFKLDLGIAAQLPEGYEVIIAPRSSNPTKKGIILANSIGVIDNSYSGNEDWWGFTALALRDTIINNGDRIAQFRIQLSQKATFWQKLKWLFSSSVELVEVDNLTSPNRGGFGSTGD